MNILALETSTAALSIALQVGDNVFTRHEVLPRQHAKLILPWVEELLSEAHLTLSNLDKLSVGCGPGGFTGIRIGMGVVQGIALAQNLPIVPVSSLRALAQWVMDQETAKQVIVAQDARMGQVYWAAYQSDDQGVAQLVLEDQLCNPSEVPVPDGKDWLTVGDAWPVYPELQTIRQQFTESEHVYPHAQAVLKLSVQGEQVSAEKALPIYLRGKDAWKKKDQ